MHKTAFLIAEQFLKFYVGASDSIVEVGSWAVNGDIRNLAPRGSTYIGLDVAEGPGVDQVVIPGAPLPFETGSVDAVIASSAFEHDPRFWRTFDEMCRILKPGGHIYLNVPSNGPVHRYALDCWRFYPDAGLALEQSSKAGAFPVSLVESFVSRQQGHTWNDFVAVFQREGGIALPDRIHMRIPCENVHDPLNGLKDTGDHLVEDFRLTSHWHAEAVRQHDRANVALADYGQAREEVAHWHALAVQQHHELNRSQAELGLALEEVKRLRANLGRHEAEVIPISDAA